MLHTNGRNSRCVCRFLWAAQQSLSTGQAERFDEGADKFVIFYNCESDVTRFMKRKVVALALAGALVLSLFGSAAAAEGTIDVVTTAHLDTVWSWDLETTISDYIPKTFIENFELADNYPDFQFNFEGAYRYQLLEEYYPELFEKLGGYIERGQWNVAGSALENGDVNTPSPEALFRNILYGNNYWKDKFGVTSRDIFLPDCFGFGYALPSIAAHSNLIGFSTQKLSWGNSFPGGNLPFDIGKWVGVDGSYVVANINYNNYTNSYNSGVRGDGDANNKLNRSPIGRAAMLTGFGGDRGGGVYEATVRAVSKEIAANNTNSVKVRFASTDDLFKEIAADSAKLDALPSYDGEMVMKKHGAGCYTSRALSKRWNRRAELIADAAERANVASSYLGATEYPADKFEEIWTRVVAHQFHDDITGTSNATTYARSYNDYMVAIKQAAAEYTSGVGGVAASMDTRPSKAEAVPVVVSNPLAAERTDAVECTLTLDSTLPYVRVFDDEGNEVAAQVNSRVANEYEIVFIATVGSMGYRTYSVLPSSIPSQVKTGLSVRGPELSNDKYKVYIDENGDIASITDKELNQEILSDPIRLSLFDESYIYWAAWELNFEDYSTQLGDDYVSNAGIKVLEKGPARVAVELTRTNGGSTYTQVVSLTAGGQVVRVDNAIDWEEKGKLLKAEFNLAASNPTATYDLGLGAIERANNNDDKAEVPVQKWADVTDKNGSFGVSVLNDCKYGMDKYDDNTIRLTLLHTPQNDYSHDSDQYGYDGECGAAGQNVQDMGLNEFAFGVYSHEGGFSGSDVQIEAEAFNQPMNAFAVTAHEGVLGSSYSFGGLSNDRVLVRALKGAESSDEIVIRVNEGSGEAQTGVELTLGSGIERVREIYASEESVENSTAAVRDGKLVFDIGAYGVKSFALTLKDAPTGLAGEKKSTAVELPYNIDAYSSNANRADGGINLIGDCYPTELIGARETVAGITYQMGDMTDGAKNAVKAAGQTIKLPAGYTTLHLLAASTGGDKEATFLVDGKAAMLEIGDYAENIGAGDIRSLGITGYVKEQVPAIVATHRHTFGEDNVAAITYMFSYTIDITGAAEITLPNDSDIILFAATAADEENSRISAVSRLHDERERTAETRTALTFDFEGEDSALSINNSMSNITAVDNAKAELSTEQAYSGRSSLKVSGSDTSTEKSYVYLDLSRESFTVVPGTVLTYKFYAGNELGRYAAVDLRMTWGDPLRDRKSAVDAEGLLVHPNIGHGKVGEWVTVTIDLYAYAPGSVLDAVMIAYDHPGDTGNFTAYIDDLYIGVPEDYFEQVQRQAAAIDRSLYTEESLGELDAAYTFAKTVSADASANCNDISTAASRLGKAIRNLIEKRSAYKDIFAPDYNKKRTSSVKIDKENGVAKNLGGISDESWVIYKGIQFGDKGADKVTLNYSGWNTGEAPKAEIRLGDQHGELVGTVTLPQTSTQQGSADWSIYTTASADLNRVLTGEQDIAIVFLSEKGGNVCNLKSLVFGEADTRTALEALVKRAQEADLTGLPTEKTQALESAITSAQAALADSAASEEKLSSAFDTLLAALNALSDTVKLGDVDGDGSVTVSDVVELRKLIVKGSWTDREFAAGNLVDSDQNLTVSDVVALRALIVKG